jgi:hypothetical protein
MKKLLVLLFVFSIVSCQKKDEKENEVASEPVKTEEKEFEMYQMSEMAALMEQMYVDNQRLKDRIIKGDTIGKFPQHFLNIHKAVMTDEDLQRSKKCQRTL